MKKTEEIPFVKKAGDIEVLRRLRFLNDKQRHAVLATDSSGQPYTSLVAFAVTPDSRGILFATPRKTTKYGNIRKNKNVALMIDSRSNTPKGYMSSEALTILGTAVPLRRGKKLDDFASIFIKKHPQLAGFVNAPSTALVVISIKKVVHAGKFQTVTEWEPE